eukprot:293642-Prorocentrum_minimum.AAC.2
MCLPTTDCHSAAHSATANTRGGPTGQRARTAPIPCVYLYGSSIRRRIPGSLAGGWAAVRTPRSWAAGTWGPSSPFIRVYIAV